MFHIQTAALPRKCPPAQSISMHPNEWAPPVVLYEDPFTNQVACVSVRVRLLLGDTFLDVHQRLKPEDVTCETVCTRIIERQNISAEASKLFALWIVGKDLEIQIRPKTNLVDIVKDWRQLVVKYTHFPQAVDPDHMFNRYWLLFRREASVCKKVERELTLKDTIALKMLFGEAKRNIITGRYPCSVKDAINLAALQLQVSIGNYDPIRCPSGYVAKNPDLIKNILSAKIVKKKTVWSWEKHIRNEHERLKDISTKRAQVCFLDYVRQWRCYGCSFFPVTKDAPPGGFFEFRQQNWMIGVGPDGIIVFEKDRNTKYHFIETWPYLKWIHSDDTIIFYDAKSSRNAYRLITPQAELIHNLAARIAHLVRKGAMKGAVSQGSLAPVENLTAIMRLHPTSSAMLDSLPPLSSPPVKELKQKEVLGSGDTLADAADNSKSFENELQVSLEPEATTTNLDEVCYDLGEVTIMSPAVAAPIISRRDSTEARIAYIDSLLVPSTPFIQISSPQVPPTTPTFNDVFGESNVSTPEPDLTPSRPRSRSFTPIARFQGSAERSRALSISSATSKREV